MLQTEPGASSVETDRQKSAEPVKAAAACVLQTAEAPMTTTDTASEPPFEPHPFEPGERLGVLIEKSVRGALTEDEQRELGEALAADPRLRRELSQSINESADIHALVQRAMDEFDPETARHAIGSELDALARAMWRVPLMVAGSLAGFAVLGLALGTHSPGFWLFMALIFTIGVGIVLAQFTRARRRALDMRRAAHESDAALGQSFERHRVGVEAWIRWYRVAAVAMPVCMLGLMFTGDPVNWIAAVAFVAGLANLYYANDQKTLDRIRGQRLGVLDRKGRPISKKGGPDDAA